MAEIRYWRVSLDNGEDEDVKAEYAGVTEDNNLNFSNEDEPYTAVATFSRGRWTAFRLIDKLGGKALHTTNAPRQTLVVDGGVVGPLFGLRPDTDS